MMKKRLDQIVYEYVVGQIENGELLEREHLTEQYFANLLGISRTPVRKAFSRLVEEGYLEDIANVGVRVKEKEITTDDFKDRLNLFERLINFYLFDLEKKEVAFDTASLEAKVDLLKASFDSGRKEFSTIEMHYWEDVLKYNTNKFSKKVLLKAMRDCLGLGGNIGEIMRQSRPVIIGHSEQLMRHLGNQDYANARREIRIFLNQLKLNVVEMS